MKKPINFELTFIKYSNHFIYKLFVMIKFNSISTKGRSTCTSKKANTPKNNERSQKNITPFVFNDQSPSQIYNKVDNSPLQIPLALALKQLANQQLPQKMSRPKTSLQCYGEMESRSCESQWGELRRSIDGQKLTNLKNILQQFMETLYYELQKELQAKFSAEMKRIVIKYRETDRLLKKIQHKITSHADLVDLEQRTKVIQTRSRKEISELENRISYLTKQIQEKNESIDKSKRQMQKLKGQNQRLELRIQKYENAFILKIKQTQQQNIPNIPKQPISTRQVKMTPYQIPTCMSILPEAPKSQLSSGSVEPIRSSGSSLSASQLTNINKLQPSSSPIAKRTNKNHSLREQGQKKKKGISFGQLIKKQRK